MEQLDYNLLFRWFVGFLMDTPIWDASAFSKNRDRLLAGDEARKLLAAVVGRPHTKALMSHEHFSVDGTHIQAWASHKSFQPRGRAAGAGADDGPPDDAGSPPGRNAERYWRGQRGSNEAHAGTTDPDARLGRKSDGQSSIMAYARHVLMENRSGLVAHSCLTHATGTAAGDAALSLVDRLAARHRITMGADKGYDVAGFIAALRKREGGLHSQPKS